MKKVIATLTTIALVAIGTVFVFSQTAEKTERSIGKFGKRGHFGGRHKRGRMMAGRLFRHLDLSEEQKNQLKEIRQATRETTKPIRQQMKQNREALRELTSDGNFDESAVQAIAAQQGSLTAQLIVEKERAKAAMFAVLTAEQKAKVSELKAQIKERREARKAKWAERKEAVKTIDN